VRVQGLYGAGGRNFSSKLYDLIRAGTPIKLDCERRVQPTWARSAARTLAWLLESGHTGLYHVSCAGQATWAGFARALAERLGLPAKWQEVPTSALSAPAARPPNCLFEHRMLSLRGAPPPPDWRDALHEYLEEMKTR
jgi:dTDP-4-dehydrorhamnose reductase